MEKTIKKDQERNIIKSELLNDNTLLEFVAKNHDIIASVRYIDSPITGIRENILFKMDVADYTKHVGEIIQISEEKEAIAIFQPIEEGYQLKQVYDTQEHQFAISEFVDLVYKKHFPTQPLKNAYIKEKK